MAGIGEASAIIGVVELGFSLAKALNNYVSNVSAAPEDVSSLGSEIEATLSHLRGLKTLIEKNEETEAWDEDGLALAKRSITDCDQIVKKLRRLVSKASWRNFESDEEFDTRSLETSEIDLTLFQKALWPKFKPDLEICKSRLQMIKLNIILAHNAYMIGSASTEAEKARYRDAIQGLSRARKWNSKKMQRVRKARQSHWSQQPSEDTDAYDNALPSSQYASRPPYVDDEVDAELQEDFERFLDEEEEKQNEAERNFVLAQEARKREEEEARRKKVEKKAIDTYIADIRKSEHALQRKRDDLQEKLERRGGLTPQQIESIIDDIHPRNKLNEALLRQDGEEEDQSQALVLASSKSDVSQVSDNGFDKRPRFSMSRILRPFSPANRKRSEKSNTPEIPSPWQDPTTRTGFANLESWYISTTSADMPRSHRLRAPLPQSSMLKKLMHTESHGVDPVWGVLLRLSSDMIYEIKSLLEDRAQERPEYEWSMMWIDVRGKPNDQVQAFKVGPFKVQARLKQEEGECVYIILKYEERLPGRPGSRERSRSPSTSATRSEDEPVVEVSSPVRTRHVSISQRPNSIIDDTPLNFVRKRTKDPNKDSHVSSASTVRPIRSHIEDLERSRRNERTRRRRSGSRSRSRSRDRSSSPVRRRVVEESGTSRSRSSFVARGSRVSGDGAPRSYIIKDGKPVPVKPPQPQPAPPPLSGFPAGYPPPPATEPGRTSYPPATSEGYSRTAQPASPRTAGRLASGRVTRYERDRSSSPPISPRRRSWERRNASEDDSYNRTRERERRRDSFQDNLYERGSRERPYYEPANPYGPYYGDPRGRYANPPAPYSPADYAHYPPMPLDPETYGPIPHHGPPAHGPYYPTPLNFPPWHPLYRPAPPRRRTSVSPPRPPYDSYSPPSGPKPQSPPPRAAGASYGLYEIQRYSDPIATRHEHHPPPAPPVDVEYASRSAPIRIIQTESHSPQRDRASRSSRRRASASPPPGKVTELSDSRSIDDSSDSEEELRRRIVQSAWGGYEKAEATVQRRDKRKARARAKEEERENEVSYFDDMDKEKEDDELAARLSKKLVKVNGKKKRKGRAKADSKKEDEDGEKNKRYGGKSDSNTRLSDIVEEEEEIGNARSRRNRDEVVVVEEIGNARGRRDKEEVVMVEERSEDDRRRSSLDSSDQEFRLRR